MTLHFFSRNVLTGVLLLAWAMLTGSAYAAEPVKIGILSFRPKPQVLAQWQPLSTVLKQSIPERNFTVEVFDHKELSHAVATRQLDFVVTSPAHYILLARRGGMSAPLATVAENMGGKPVTVLGGAIFCRIGNGAIRSLAELKGKTIAATSPESIYSYQAQAYELMRAGVSLPQDARMMFIGTSNDGVVEAVLSGRADAGFVRAGALEDMAREGKMDLAQIRVVNLQPFAEYPAQVSTRLYPGRVFSALPHIDENLSRRVTAALFLLEENRAATGAMNIHGFVIPPDYTVVSDMLRELRLPPFDAAPEFTLRDVWHQYRGWIVTSLAGTLLLILLSLWVSLANRKLKEARLQVADQLAFINAVIQAEVNGLAVCHAMDEPPYTCFTVWNPSMEALTGYSLEEINRLGWYQTVYPDPEIQERARQRMEHMREGEHLDGEEWTITRKDGEQRIVRIYTVTVAKDALGVHTLAIMRDITERKQAEEELKLSAQLLGAVSDTVFLLDLDGNFVYMNEDAWKSRGYTRDEMMKMNLREINAPEFNQFVAPRMKALLENGESRFESAHRRKDGSIMPVEVNARVIESGGRKLLLSAIRDITERKQVMQSIKAQARLLDMIFKYSLDSIVLLDKDYNFIRVSEAYARACQRDATEFPGHNHFEFYPSDLRDEFEGTVRNKIVYSCSERPFAFSDHPEWGVTYWDLECVPALDQQGEIEFFIFTLKDVTRRKLAEEKLRASEARFRAILEATPLPLVLNDEHGNITYLNNAFVQTLGYTLNDIPSLDDWWQKAYPDPQYQKWVIESWQGNLDNARRSSEPFISLEMNIRCKDGTERIFMADASPIIEGYEGIYIVILSDITRRRRTENELREKTRLLDSIIENIPNMIFLKRASDLRFELFNRAGEVLVGHSRGELVGRNDYDFFPKEQADFFTAKDRAVLDHEGVLDIPEEPIETPRGTRILHTKKIAIRDELGQPRFLLGISEDITERMEREEEIRRSNAELEQFGYAVSHDMRQPLRMIASYLQLIEMELGGQLDVEKRGYFDFAIEGAKRIDQMLVALLEYSRVGRLGAPPVWMDSRAILEEALQYLQPAIAEAGAKVEVSGEWPRVFINRDEILRLMQNLIGNAVKFRIAGRVPEIAVSSEAVDGEWRCCVADNGVGILPDQLNRLFQIFQRLQLRTAYEGNGVGLALCRKIAEHHRGRIWAESAGKGQGSRFCVVLPVLREKPITFGGENI